MSSPTPTGTRRARLGINIDHVATLRQARGTAYPSVADAARTALAAGADSITVHLREDRRHIQDVDVEQLTQAGDIAINLEIALTDEMLAIAAARKPRDACLVPEKRAELTTEGGLDIAGQLDRVRQGLSWLNNAGIHTALFIDPDPAQIRAAARAGAAAIELHTGAYADAADEAARDSELERLVAAAHQADALGLEVHAGHGLSLANVEAIAAIEPIVELNIGHSIIAHAVFVGLAAAVRDMRAAMNTAGQGAR